MRLFIILVLSLVLKASASAAEHTPGIWSELTNCTLVKSGLNDGDSFLVKHATREDVFRLYYVDTPEKYNTYRQRVLDQARYFSIPEQGVISAGIAASNFTDKFLKGEFTVVTKWEDARGDSQPRYFAMIIKEGRHLSTELVRNGLARIYGMPTFERWPHGYPPKIYLSILKDAERYAQSKKSGIWSQADSSAQVSGLANLKSQGVMHVGNEVLITTETEQSLAMNDRMLNINAAPASELETLPGIGPALAAAIVAARPFSSLEALVEIPGISANKLAAIRPYIILNEAPPPKKTADYYYADLKQYLNTEITVAVASLAFSDASSPEGFKAIQLETSFEGRNAGSIIALIPDEYFESFVEHYSLPGREFSGLFYEYKDEKVLVYQRK